jgi:hypothetical protein
MGWRFFFLHRKFYGWQSAFLRQYPAGRILFEEFNADTLFSRKLIPAAIPQNLKQVLPELTGDCQPKIYLGIERRLKQRIAASLRGSPSLVTD